MRSFHSSPQRPHLSSLESVTLIRPSLWSSIDQSKVLQLQKSNHFKWSIPFICWKICGKRTLLKIGLSWLLTNSIQLTSSHIIQKHLLIKARNHIIFGGLRPFFLFMQNLKLAMCLPEHWVYISMPKQTRLLPAHLFEIFKFFNRYPQNSVTQCQSPTIKLSVIIEHIYLNL